MINDDKVISKFEFECSCGCGELKFSQWLDDGVSFISYNIPAYFASQKGRWDRIINAIKVFWSLAILDKEYCFYEIIIEDNKKLKEFKEFVSKMREIEENSNE